MSGRSNVDSLFDDIFKIQNAAPEPEADPEDPEDGFRSGLAEGTEEVEEFGPTDLRRKAAIIVNDPKYKGKRTSRKNLYSDDDEESNESDDGSQEDDAYQDSDQSDSEDEEEETNDEDMDDNEESDFEDNDAKEEERENVGKKEEAPFSLTKPEPDEREKGKAVAHQLDVWDDLIKCRISLQRLVTFCNQLPQGEIWYNFAANESFNKGSRNAHSSIRKLMSSFLDLQTHLLNKQDTLQIQRNAPKRIDGMDEEITSSEDDEGEGSPSETLQKTLMKNHPGANVSTDEMEVDKNVEHEEDEGELAGELTGESEGEDISEDESDAEKEEDAGPKKELLEKLGNKKRKLTFSDMEESLAKKHKDYRSFRNETLEKWDEKTRLSHGKIKSKNFSAFDMSVLKQIKQVLANKDRLVRRIHQQRTSNRVLGQPEAAEEGPGPDSQTVEDEDDDVEMKQRTKIEMPINEEIIDDNDFYHICLRDFIEMKRNEETDSTTNRQWLEIQKLRSKQKRKVDTRASKGRKIRYNVKEKLKNYMAPFDKSIWNEDQKDDLFKALFGGKHQRNDNTVTEQPTINIGL